MGLKFYNDRICLNCLTNDVDNAKEIYEACDGYVALGLLTANYNSVEEAVTDMKRYQGILNNNISVGLGQGNPKFWNRVACVSKELVPNHINQVFSATGYTRALVNSDEPFINSLVSPSGEIGKVVVSTGELSSTASERAVVDIRTAILMAKEMGANSIKFFPMKGLKAKEELKEVAKACAELDFGLEPTGGIDLDNFEEIVQIIYDANVKKIIPHVYSSIIDKETGKTRVEDVKKLFEIMKKIVK